MTQELRALIVEDSEDDALLLVGELQRGGYEPLFERVDSPETMTAALARQRWDIVFADYTMPHFRGTDALELLKGRGLDVPFIFVSGTIGEDTAVAAMKAGAHDYVLKGNLKRLLPAVERELREAEVRRRQRRAEEEIQRQHEHLSRLYEETKRQAEELEKANRVKSEFLGVISHELKTPLNVIMGYTGMIKEKILADQDRALGKIAKHCNDLMIMIESILNATRIEAGAVSAISEEVHLDNFISEIRSIYDFPLDKSVTLIWDCPSGLPPIKTDGVKLRHILLNVINNAIKFTEEGSVTVSARLLPVSPIHPPPESGKRGIGDAEKWVEFKVADTGIGIPQEKIPIIFEMFRQVDSSTKRSYGGTGIGLHIVKTFTEMLGGKIDVESEPGKGSTFTVTIPCET